MKMLNILCILLNVLTIRIIYGFTLICCLILATNSFCFWILLLVGGLFFACRDFHGLLNILRNWNIHRIPLGFINIHILYEEEDVQNFLKTSSTLGFPAKNFELAHGHTFTIESFESNTAEWKTLHHALLRGATKTRTERLQQILEKHQYRLVPRKNGTEIVANIVASDFVKHVWAEFCFGQNVNVEKWWSIRAKLLILLKITYYDNWFQRFPFLGAITCQTLQKLHSPQFKELDQEILDLLHRCENDVCFMSEFRKGLEGEHAFRCVLDNAFLSFLVYDFMYVILLDLIVKIGKSCKKVQKSVIAEAVHDGFFFPFRFRVAGEQSNTCSGIKIKPGDFVLVNLLTSKKPFSFGKRMCVGMAVFQKVAKFVQTTYKNRLIETKPTNIVRSKNKDIPEIVSKHTFRFYDESFLCKYLESMEFKGLANFKNVNKIFQDPPLFAYILKILFQNIETCIEHSQVSRRNIVLAAPEARGFILAGALANMCKLPLVIIRKPNKIPGPILSRSFDKAYEQDTIEIGTDFDLRSKKVILIDDGLATGGTLLAATYLLEENFVRCQVVSVQVAILHAYALHKCPEELLKKTCYVFRL